MHLDALANDTLFSPIVILMLSAGEGTTDVYKELTHPYLGHVARSHDDSNLNARQTDGRTDGTYRQTDR